MCGSDLWQCDKKKRGTAHKPQVLQVLCAVSILCGKEEAKTNGFRLELMKIHKALAVSIRRKAALTRGFNEVRVTSGLQGAPFKVQK